jgi:hypothetical protein
VPDAPPVAPAAGGAPGSGVALGSGVGFGVGSPLAGAVGMTVGATVGSVGSVESVGSGVGEPLGVAVGVPVVVGEPGGVDEPVGSGVAVGVGVGVGVAVDVGVAVGVGVAVAVGIRGAGWTGEVVGSGLGDAVVGAGVPGGWNEVLGSALTTGTATREGPTVANVGDPSGAVDAIDEVEVVAKPSDPGADPVPPVRTELVVAELAVPAETSVRGNPVEDVADNGFRVEKSARTAVASELGPGLPTSRTAPPASTVVVFCWVPPRTETAAVSTERVRAAVAGRTETKARPRPASDRTDAVAARRRAGVDRRPGPVPGRPPTGAARCRGVAGARGAPGAREVAGERGVSGPAGRTAPGRDVAGRDVAGRDVAGTDGSPSASSESPNDSGIDTGTARSAPSARLTCSSSLMAPAQSGQRSTCARTRARSQSVISPSRRADRRSPDGCQSPLTC